MIWTRRAVLRASVGLVAAACATTPAAVASDARPNDPLAANADLGIWPDRITKSAREIREAYEYAVRRPRSLQFIPCYCGCGAQGHRNNQDCYVREFLAKGWVALDLHGYG
ncbi:MAG TPA: PCYCGC motif-containing (lipo)protein [Candidatus Limnocylindria bacterium]|nr:PCYCGC motif-containing (lipo)protein [Candidatus Limnocylindria bacterium]